MSPLLQPLLSQMPLSESRKAPAGTFRPARVSPQVQFNALMGCVVEVRPARRSPVRLPAGVTSHEGPFAHNS